MNCTEARVLLAAHRELKHVDVDTVELDEHLEQCSSCREVLASYSLIGEQVRALPRIEPTPDMHPRLMKALAAEHFQFMQRSPSATPPPPAFLRPYLQEHAREAHQSEMLAAFSTAETGPLPILKPLYKKRRSPLRQYAAIGLAAVFLLTLMMGGITSLLLLAHDHINSGSGPAASVIHPTDVVSAAYTTDTVYQHVVSAVGDRNSIYYTAYGDGTNDGWMLEQLDRSTQLSMPLLATASPSPLIVLGSENGWLVWLQFDSPKTTARGNMPGHTMHPLLRTWSLHYMSLASQAQADASTANDPLTLVSGTFDQEAVTDWVHTPVQGIWFIQNSLLVALIDDSGISHLIRYPLGTTNGLTATEIARASPDHVFTSPTANSDGSQIYWSDEWRTDDGNLHSNVWTQQILDNPATSHGKRVQQTTTVKQLFLQDGMAFRPLVADETLFVLSTADGLNASQTTPTVTAQAAQTGTPLPTATPNTYAAGVTWADTSIYTPPADNGIRGSIIMFPPDSELTETPTLVSTMGSASGLQAGSDFVLWQTDDGSYGMYDVAARTYITVGEVLNGAQFLAVNGDTAVWTTDTPTSPATAGVNTSATLFTFNWPRK